MSGRLAESARLTVALSRARVVERNPSKPLQAASRSLAMAAEAVETSETAFATLSRAAPLVEQKVLTLFSSMTNWLKSIGQLLKSPETKTAATFPSLIFADALAAQTRPASRVSQVSANWATISASDLPFREAASVGLSRPRNAFTIISGELPFMAAKTAETWAFVSSGQDPHRLEEVF